MPAKRPNPARFATLLPDPVSAVRVFLRGGQDLEPSRAWVTLDEEEKDAPHQGREAGTRSEVRQARDRHRLAGGADRDADPTHQRADRAPPLTQARSLLASRAAEARRPSPPFSELFAAEKPRGVPHPHQGAWSEALGARVRTQIKEGGVWASAPPRTALTQT